MSITKLYDISQLYRFGFYRQDKVLPEYPKMSEMDARQF